MRACRKAKMIVHSASQAQIEVMLIEALGKIQVSPAESVDTTVEIVQPCWTCKLKKSKAGDNQEK